MSSTSIDAARDRADEIVTMTTMPECDVVTIGEPLVLFAAAEPGPLSTATHFERFSAGAELNVAIGLARLGYRVGYLSRVGNDSFGRYLLAVLDREGIDRSCVAVDPERGTGFMLKSVEQGGRDPAIEYHRRGSAASAMSIAYLGGPFSPRTRHLHLTGIGPALSASCRALVLHRARASRGAHRLSFDPNLRPALWPDQADMVATLNAIAALSDLVLPGLEEGRLLTGRHSPEDIASFYLDLGAREVIVKLGEDGALCASREAGVARVPGRRVAQVVDTVGAGDAFAVGAISAQLEGSSLAEAAARGNAFGARAVQFASDNGGLPTRAELDAGWD